MTAHEHNVMNGHSYILSYSLKADCIYLYTMSFSRRLILHLYIHIADTMKRVKTHDVINLEAIRVTLLDTKRTNIMLCLGIYYPIAIALSFFCKQLKWNDIMRETFTIVIYINAERKFTIVVILRDTHSKTEMLECRSVGIVQLKEKRITTVPCLLFQIGILCIVWHLVT